MPVAIFGQDLNMGRAVASQAGLDGLPQLIANALAMERERCAKIVENMGRSNGKVRKSHKVIAAEIRSGNSRIGKL